MLDLRLDARGVDLVEDGADVCSVNSSTLSDLRLDEIFGLVSELDDTDIVPDDVNDMFELDFCELKGDPVAAGSGTETVSGNSSCSSISNRNFGGLS